MELIKKNISVLGCGRWGSFLAWYSNKLGHNVKSFGLETSKSYQILKETRQNEYVKLDKEIELTSDLETALDSDIIIISISSQGLREFLKKVTRYNIEDKIFVLCMKGIEEATGKRLTEVAVESGVNKNNVAVWVGPGHIQDFTKNIPNCMVIDAYNSDLVLQLAQIFKSELIRFYLGRDIIGTEVGAATKNIMGIVAGVLDGLNLSTLKGALMARGAREVSRLITALGGNPLSAYGLCHLGDYETTLFSKYSNNRGWGENYAKNLPFSKLAEGVSTARAVAKVARRLNVDMPITFATDKAIEENIPPKEILKILFDREIKNEFE